MSLSPEARTGPAEALERVVRRPGRGRLVVGLLLAVLAPVVVTIIGRAIGSQGTAIPALLHVLAIVGTVVVGGPVPAVIQAAVSFALLDYFFTAPTHTFTVSKGEDLFALAIFLVVALFVSAAIAAAREQQARSELRERQVRALNAVTSSLLAGSSVEDVSRSLASSIRSLYGLEGCRIELAVGDGQEREAATSGTMEGPVTSRIPLEAEGRPIGSLVMSGAPNRALMGAEGQVLKTFAGQLALALERARLGEEASEARVQAAESQNRAALFSSVTHDLRTPLASITASASSLLEEGVPFTDDQRRELLRTILEESARLNRLVANLMDLSRLRAGALLPVKERVPFEEVVSSVIERLRPQLQGRAVRILIRDDIPPVPVDAVQMDQAITNIVENALGYSAPGTEIAIAAARWQSWIEVRIADRGPGIPEAERTRVFEEFYRRDVGDRRGGTGLGLAIARAVIQAHGGSMWIEDTPGGGTTVGFRIPLESDRTAPAARPPATKTTS